MANKKNKVKFGLTNVHYAKIKDWVTDASGANLTPVYVNPVRLPGAVSISIDANGEAENFFADNGVYYVINNNAGYTGDLEIALITTEFATEILGEILDNNGVLVEKNDTELAQFALMFEFLGDKHHIRHVMYCCSASRPATDVWEGTQFDVLAIGDESYSFADRSCQVQNNGKHHRSGLQQLVQNAV